MQLTPSVLAFYAAARAEIVQRLQLRDTLLFVYLGASATLLGLAAKKDLEAWFLFPLLIFIVTALILRNEWMIHYIRIYIHTELIPGKVVPPPWDLSETLRKEFMREVRTAPLVKALALMLPVGIASYKHLLLYHFEVWTQAMNALSLAVVAVLYSKLIMSRQNIGAFTSIYPEDQKSANG